MSWEEVDIELYLGRSASFPRQGDSIKGELPTV